MVPIFHPKALAMPHPSQLLPIGSELWVGASTPSNVSRVVAVGTYQGDMNEWAWEMGSQCSVPSAWSKPSTLHSSVSKLSSATGDGLIPGLVDGQRLSSVKPISVPTSGGKVVVSLRKEAELFEPSGDMCDLFIAWKSQVPQGFWDRLAIFLVNGPVQKRLTPTGVKRGKKLCVEVPSGMEPGDYDVRLAFGEKIIHGAIPLAVRDGDGEEEDFSD
eukprot:symbB.v1.2.013677.t1/scaffold971.1/size148033/5